jgi:hypothetical protein
MVVIYISLCISEMTHCCSVIGSLGYRFCEVPVQIFCPFFYLVTFIFLIDLREFFILDTNNFSILYRINISSIFKIYIFLYFAVFLSLSIFLRIGGLYLVSEMFPYTNSIIYFSVWSFAILLFLLFWVFLTWHSFTHFGVYFDIELFFTHG